MNKVYFNEEVLENIEGKENLFLVNLKSEYGYSFKCIKKIFPNRESALKEWENSKIVNNYMDVYPKIIEINDNFMYREYMEGFDLDEVIKKYRCELGYDCIEYVSSIFFSVIDMMHHIHNELKNFYKKDYMIYDTEFNNFIITDEKIYCINLESVQPGNAVMDYAKLCAHVFYNNEQFEGFNKLLVESAIDYINNTILYSNDMVIDDVYRELEKLYSIL